MKTAVLLVNTGTPDKASHVAVAKFLCRFLNDKRVIDLAFLPRFLLVNLIIIPLRLRKVVKKYKDYHQQTKTNITHITQEVARKLNERLPNNYKAYAAMRYSTPSLRSVLNEVRGKEFEKLIIIPLYPQYTEATSGSIIAKAHDIVNKWEKQPEVKIIYDFYKSPHYHEAVKKTANTYELNNYDKIIFSYHSLPLRQIASAENTPFCYRTACHSTTRLLAKNLNLDESHYCTCFQSSMGKAWLGPSVNKTLIQLAHEGKNNILLLPVGFISDCLETRYELGIESTALFIQNGGEKLEVAPCLNSHNMWIETLLKLITQ